MPGIPVDGGCMSISLSAGSELKYAFEMSAQYNFLCFDAAQLHNKFSPSTAVVGESVLTSGQFSKFPQATNLDLYFGVCTLYFF